MKHSIVLLSSILLLCLFALQTGYSQNKMKKRPTVTSEQVKKLRHRAERDADFRAQLMSDRKTSARALASVIGPMKARYYKIHVGPKERALDETAASASTGARLTTSSTLDLSAIALYMDIPPYPGTSPAYQGTAASTFCLAEDHGDNRSWECVDEEVEITDTGHIRGVRGAGK